MKLKALALALMCALSFAPAANAWSSFSGGRSISISRSVTIRPTTIPRVPRITTPRITTPKPRITAPYTGTKSTTIVHHDSITSSPWFWMWLMSNDDHTPKVWNTGASKAESSTGAWVFLGTFVGGLALLILFVTLI